MTIKLHKSYCFKFNTEHRCNHVSVLCIVWTEVYPIPSALLSLSCVSMQLSILEPFY